MATRLSIVQDILSDADSDDVNSITDTVEAGQCDTVLKNSFYSIVDVFDLPATMNLFWQTGLVINNTQFLLSADLNRVQWLKYDVGDAVNADWSEMHYKHPAQWLETAQSLDNTASNVEEHTFNSAKYYIYNDRRPRYWTSFDDKTVVFDSYDIAVDLWGLVPSKLQGYALNRPAYPTLETTEFALPKELEQLLIDEAREMFFDLYKDGATRKVNQRARRSRVRAQRNKNKFVINDPGAQDLPDYGRGGSGRQGVKEGMDSGGSGRPLPAWWPS